MVNIHDFTVLFDTYTGKYVPNGKQLDNILTYQENKTRSFENCMAFFDSIAKKPKLNATRLHYVNSKGIKNTFKTISDGMTGEEIDHSEKPLPSNTDEKSLLFDIRLQTYKSTLSSVLPNTMVKPA